MLGEKVENLSPEFKTWEVVWSLLDERIVNIAISRVEAGHFADAVFNSMLLVNSRVRTEYLRKKPGKEIDGVDLMHQAFGSKSNPPVIPLDDLSTMTGRNRQEGYHNIFAGAMQAIRNPKAHGFENITEGRTIHHLFVASLLMSVLDEAKIK